MTLNTIYGSGIAVADTPSQSIKNGNVALSYAWATTWLSPSLGNRWSCSDDWLDVTCANLSQTNFHSEKNSVIFVCINANSYDHFSASRWQDFRPHWIQVAESDVHGLTLDSVKAIMLELSELLAKRAFTSVSHGLDSATLSNMSQDAIMAILRITFSARKLLSGWSNFLDRGEEVLSLRDLNPASIVSLRIAASR